MSNASEEIYETLSRLVANGEKKRLAASSLAAVTVPKDDQLCTSIIERSMVLQ